MAVTALYCDAYTLGARYFTESILSISSPFSADCVVVMLDIPVVTAFSTFPILDTIVPENVKLLAPFPSIPLLIIYDTLILLPFAGFFPKILSPNIIWYFSSAISCTRKSLDRALTSKIFRYSS